MAMLAMPLELAGTFSGFNTHWVWCPQRLGLF